jgi:hypothetical protein
MNADLAEIGLEPTKKAYDEKMAALRSAAKQSDGREPNWFARVVLGRQKGSSQLTGQARPCVGQNCPKPKPCPGKNCAPAPAPVCPAFHALPNGSCAPLGYIERCDDRQGTCYAHLARVNVSDCEGIRKRVEQLQQEETVLQAAQQKACSVAQSAECSTATAESQQKELELEKLQKQYQMCLMAANP